MAATQDLQIFCQNGYTRFFSVKAKVGTGIDTGYWLFVSPDSDASAPVKKRPQSVVGYILSHLWRAGNSAFGRDISQLHLSASQAMTLHLEGNIITRQHLERALVSDDCIMVPDVLIGGRTLTVCIYDYRQNSLRFANSEGATNYSAP